MPLETPNQGPTATPVVPVTSAFAPLKIPLFRDRWIASTVSNLGTWMQDTAATWLMTVLTASPLLIALMQTAASLPVLILGLLAGATADIFDRRRLLIFWQAWMLASVAVLAVLTFLGHISPWALLAFTFLLNIGSAMNNPAWQAIVPELVPQTLIPETVSLNAASNNLARAVGPALGGLMVAAFKKTDNGAGAVWALLAVVAHRDLHQGALGYGILNGSLGLGAVAAATTLPRIRHRFTADSILAAATLYDVITLLVLAFVHSPAIVIPTLIVAGAAWTSAMSTLNVSVQLSVPSWVQARALGTYLMVFQGGMALGSITWGYVAEHTSTPKALATAACGLLVTLPIVYRFHILQGPIPDHTPYQWKRPAPSLVALPDHEHEDPSLAGPVRISVEFVIPLENYAEFTRAIHDLRGVRLRDGAIRWGIYRDALNPERLNETFIMESWLDYLRSRERVTAADEQIRSRVWALHQHAEPPKVTYQIYAREIANPTPAST